jgi:hypothetical protein
MHDLATEDRTVPKVHSERNVLCISQHVTIQTISNVLV